jgi:hypothetical protein
MRRDLCPALQGLQLQGPPVVHLHRLARRHLRHAHHYRQSGRRRYSRLLGRHGQVSINVTYNSVRSRMTSDVWKSEGTELIDICHLQCSACRKIIGKDTSMLMELNIIQLAQFSLHRKMRQNCQKVFLVFIFNTDVYETLKIIITVF